MIRKRRNRKEIPTPKTGVGKSIFAIGIYINGPYRKPIGGHSVART